MEDEPILHSQFIITRFDQYYNNINNKGQFYLGINSLLIGAAISLILKISKYCSSSGWFYSLVVVFSLLGFCSVVLTLAAIHPYLKKGAQPQSFIFFKSISEFKSNVFIHKYITQSKQEMIEDMAYQIHALSVGLNSKFRYLQYASYFLMGEFICGFIIIILISKNTSL